MSVCQQLEKRNPGMYKEGPMRWMPSDVKGEHTWTFNKRFKIIKGKEYFNEETGELIFPDNGKIYENDIHYMTKKFKKFIFRFGWGFAHSGVIYNNSNRNIQAMLSRHFQVKLPKNSVDQDEIGNLAYYGIKVDASNFDMNLRTNQNNWYRIHTSHLTSILRVSFGVHEYHFDIREAAIFLAAEPHQKKKLREKALQELILSQAWVRSVWTKTLTWKIKFIEIAKADKDPRVIVDANAENSLPRVHFANSWKGHTADKLIDFGRVKVKFCSSPNPIDIREVFKESLESTDGITILNYSDDAIISIVVNGKREIYNVDISSNDSSHGFAVFECYAQASNMDRDQKENLFAVIKNNFVIHDENKELFAIFKPLEGYLPSGIGDTTVCNNMVYCMVGYALNLLISLGHEADIKLLTFAGYLCGFRFSYEKTSKIGDLQFLKNSPFLRHETIYSLPNLGILLRYSGCCENQLPAINYPEFVKTFQDKCAFFQTLLTYGFFKFFRYEPLMNLCPFFQYLNRNEDKHKDELEKYKKDSLSYDTREVLYLLRNEIYGRYDVSDDDIDEFEYYVSIVGYGDLIYCPLVDIVIKKDYGLKWS